METQRGQCRARRKGACELAAGPRAAADGGALLVRGPSMCHGVQWPVSEAGSVTYLCGDFESHIFMCFSVLICNGHNNSLYPMGIL